MIDLPGSKSLTIRALAAAALADGRTHIYGPLVADDTIAMARCLQALGIGMHTGADPWAIIGGGGHLSAPPELLDAGESALTARTLSAMAALSHGEIVVTGRGTLARRPMAGLVGSLRQLGVEARSDGAIPVTISGRGGVPGGAVTVDASETSQFATALLMVSPMADAPIDLRVDGLRGSKGYLDLTVAVMGRFGAVVAPTLTGYRVEATGYQATDYVVEPDASAAVYPMLAAAITGGTVELPGLDPGSDQPDVAVADAFAAMGCRVSSGSSGMVLTGPPGDLGPFRGDLSLAPDGALAVAVACLFAGDRSEISGLASLRHKESDRITALVENIRRLGAAADADGDRLVVRPGRLRGAVIDPQGDHRIAMSFAVAGLVVDGLAIAEPGVVTKTWPGFWDVLDCLSG